MPIFDAAVGAIITASDPEVGAAICTAYCEALGLSVLTRPMLKAMSAPASSAGGARIPLCGHGICPSDDLVDTLLVELAVCEPSLMLDGSSFDAVRLRATVAELVHAAHSPLVPTIGASSPAPVDLSALAAAIGASVACAMAAGGHGARRAGRLSRLYAAPPLHSEWQRASYRLPRRPRCSSGPPLRLFASLCASRVRWPRTFAAQAVWRAVRERRIAPHAASHSLAHSGLSLRLSVLCMYM